MKFEEVINKSKNLSVAELKILIGNILKEVNYGSVFCKNQTFEGLYRARKHNQFNGENDEYLLQISLLSIF